MLNDGIKHRAMPRYQRKVMKILNILFSIHLIFYNIINYKKNVEYRKLMLMAVN